MSYAFHRRWSLTASVINMYDEPLVTYAGQPYFVRKLGVSGTHGADWAAVRLPLIRAFATHS